MSGGEDQERMGRDGKGKIEEGCVDVEVKETKESRKGK